MCVLSYFTFRLPINPALSSLLNFHLLLISAPPPKKSLKFKTTTDASETQVIDAMKKISSHINTPAKFSKAAKLAIQLIQAGSVKSATRDYYFSILEAAMSSPIPCTDPAVRADYHALFSAAQHATEVSFFFFRWLVICKA